MLGSLKFAVLQFADFHFPKNPRIARTPCTPTQINLLEDNFRQILQKLFIFRDWVSNFLSQT